MSNRKWSSRSLKNLKGIHPDLRKVMDRALQTSPLDFTVIEGLRTEKRQRELVASGASKTMNSRHLTGHAVDLLPLGPNGPAFDWPLYDKLAPAVKKAAQELGVDIEWGGDWKSFKDGPHFQLPWDKYPKDDWTSKAKAKDPAPVVHNDTTTAPVATVTAGVAGLSLTELAPVAAALGDFAPAAQIAAVVLIGAALFFLWRRGQV